MVGKKSPSLSLIHEAQLVADLSYDLDKGVFHLLYFPEWIKSGFPLSPHLPLIGEIPPENTRKFLENLLPEEDALKTLARTLKISPSNIYVLVTAIGRDATGAFTFSSEKETTKTSFRAIPSTELTERIKERATKSIALWDGKPRLSLAGVQEKLAVTLKDGTYGFGEGQLASTHILKFSKKDQHLVLNEFFCMKLAALVGIPAASVELVQFGERVLQVERFDRSWKGTGHVVRRHLIDGCQALNAPPEFKYQKVVPIGPDRNRFLGPVNVTNLSIFSQQCIVPAKAQLQLLRWILFNLIIGNTDSHGKNISYFVGPKGYEVAPAYDLVNVSMYEDFHQELAFQIGDTFELEEVKAYQLAEMTQQMKLSPRIVSSHLNKLCEGVLKHADEITIDDLSKKEKDFMSKLRANIKARAKKLLNQSSLISAAYKSL